MRRGLRPCSRGFTLLELVLVMIIACTALAIAAPMLRGWRAGAALRNVGDQFLTLTRYARSQAIVDAVKYSIDIDTRNGTFQLVKESAGQSQQSQVVVQPLTAGNQKISLPGDLGKVYHVPEGGKMELTVQTNPLVQDQNEKTEAIYFYPTGRTQMTRVRISDGQGYELEIVCESATEDFYLKYEGTVRNR
jgi:prepilin-type N-terminal cleavage/methylation domain-containing protein